MKIVICRNGKIVDILDERWNLNDYALKEKQLFIKYQTQEIYFQHASKKGWTRVNYVFQVTKSGMHPARTSYTQLNNDQMPEEVQMRALLGAL